MADAPVSTAVTTHVRALGQIKLAATRSIRLDGVAGGGLPEVVGEAFVLDVGAGGAVIVTKPATHALTGISKIVYENPRNVN